LAIVERLTANGFSPGCWMPVAIMGKDFILSLPRTSKLELPLNYVAERSSPVFLAPELDGKKLIKDKVRIVYPSRCRTRPRVGASAAK
jgi:hypothetical protein